MASHDQSYKAGEAQAQTQFHMYGILITDTLVWTLEEWLIACPKKISVPRSYFQDGRTTFLVYLMQIVFNFQLN
ncbi:hypothetical protein FRX31_025252 [Thalictrum thalictroides]|uniref:Uncharacterized protein n=1 Tax=Thalictrum thalictroides TaxID=46969 RepID=A0A7J6VLW0_THATH|nr:hypothetical protein FRX31_025252 [Thalictrum thalictroides]